jgi:hypothetical protein
MLSLDPTIQQRVNTWLQGNYDAETKTAVQALLNQGDKEAVNDAFYRDLEFGTGGLRGIMGVGTTKGFKKVKWQVAGRIVQAWVFTIPVCIVLGWVFHKALLLLG